MENVLTATWAVASVAASCGPSQVVGVVGILYYGIQACAVKIYAWLKTVQLQYFTSHRQQEVERASIERLHGYAWRCVTISMWPYVKAMTPFLGASLAFDRNF